MYTRMYMYIYMHAHCRNGHAITDGREANGEARELAYEFNMSHDRMGASYRLKPSVQVSACVCIDMAMHMHVLAAMRTCMHAEMLYVPSLPVCVAA